MQRKAKKTYDINHLAVYLYSNKNDFDRVEEKYCTLVHKDVELGIDKDVIIDKYYKEYAKELISISTFKDFNHRS